MQFFKEQCTISYISYKILCYFSVKEFALFVQMETETPLIAETIALTEKKVAMALGIFFLCL